MAVFYVLPPRPALGKCLASMLQPFIPGASINQDACADFVDSLVSGSPEGAESYVVFREDLPDGEDVNTALREGFGAEDGDQIVFVSMGSQPGEPRVKLWKIGDFQCANRNFEAREGRRETAIAF